MSLINEPARHLLLQECSAHAATKNDLAHVKDELNRAKDELTATRVDLTEAQQMNEQLEAKVQSLQGEKDWLARKMAGPAAPSASSSESSALLIRDLENQVAHLQQAASPAVHSDAIQRDNGLLNRANAALETTNARLENQIDRLTSTISDQKNKHSDEQKKLTKALADVQKELKAVQMQLVTQQQQQLQLQPTNHYSFHLTNNITQNIAMAPPVMPVAQRPTFTPSQAADSFRALAIEGVSDEPIGDIAMPSYSARCRNESSGGTCGVTDCVWLHQAQVDTFPSEVIAALPANRNDARLRLRFGRA